MLRLICWLLEDRAPLLAARARNRPSRNRRSVQHVRVDHCSSRDALVATEFFRRSVGRLNHRPNYRPSFFRRVGAAANLRNRVGDRLCKQFFSFDRLSVFDSFRVKRDVIRRGEGLHINA